MKKKFEITQKEMYRVITISVVIGVVLLVLNFFPGIREFISKLWRLMTPFFIGFALTLMVKPVKDFVERLLLKHTTMTPKGAKTIAVIVSILLVIILIVLFFVAVIPQLTNSIVTIADSVNSYSESLRKWFEHITSMFNRDADNRFVQAIENAIQQFLQALPGQIVTYLNRFIGSLSSLVTAMGYFILGLVIAVYFLFGYEKFAKWAKRMIRAFLPEQTAENVIGITRTSIRIFSKFVAGKALDSIIIGFLCLIGCLILGLEFPYLIAFVIGITNMIPFFGPFIGAIPCIFILLFNNPWHALWFGIFILVLQQFDGNYLGPKIIGGQLGLPSIMIVFSVIVGGGLLGGFGMFLGVPFFALIYTLIKDFVKKKEKEKALSTESE